MKKSRKIVGLVLSLGLLMFVLTSASPGGANAGVPFWGDGDCGPTEIVGGIGGSPCYEQTICKKYRFWIHWGGYSVNTDYDNPVPCP